jgi:hypothetical protein
MVSKFKLLPVISTTNNCHRYINDLNNHKIPGSTGRPKWWSLTPDERTEYSQGKKKLKVQLMSIGLILGATYRKNI